MSYIDTSVLVAALDHSDPRHREIRDLLEREESKVVSELVLVELASVVARREKLVSKIAEELDLDREEAVTSIVLYIIRRFNLRYRGTGGSTRVPLLGGIYEPMAKAIELSSQLRIKTLDLLHIAYAKLIKDEVEPIEKLITADRDFEKRLTLPLLKRGILASRVFIGLVFIGLVFIALLGSHLIPSHLRSRGCATTPMGIPPLRRVPIFKTPTASLWASKPQ